jgi:hypothetical protein
MFKRVRRRDVFEIVYEMFGREEYIRLSLKRNFSILKVFSTST